MTCLIFIPTFYYTHLMNIIIKVMLRELIGRLCDKEGH